MKKHFLSLFDPAHRWWTISFFLAAVLLIIAAMVVGISDNPPGIALFYSGMILLFLALVHPWRKWENYAILAGVCAGIILLVFVVLHIYAAIFITPGVPNTPTATENVIEAFLFILILFICVPGIIVGIFGAIFRAIRRK